MKNSEVLNSSPARQNASHRQISTAHRMPMIKPLVLILGKDSDTRLLYRYFLELWDYHVAEAAGVEEMLTLTAYFQPELILIDCSLKFENNIETIQKIRGNLFLQKTPLILVSGYSQQRFRETAMENGADDFLVKPLNFDELRADVERYVCPNNRDEFRRESL